MNEIWKPVKGFELLYEVSNLGNIRTLKGVYFSPFINNKGYKCVRFQVNCKVTNFLVHRLVAEHFITNINNLPEVDHLDSNPLNCIAENLEWVTHKENMVRASKRGSFKNQKNKLGNKSSKTKSQFHNVSFDKSRNKWIAGITIDKKIMFQKRFNSEIEAAKHVNWILDTLKIHNRPRNKV